MSRWHSTDGWRGYSIPDHAIAGASYTGEWADSPSPLKEVKPELNQLRAYLKKQGITSRIRASSSSNAFMTKLWVIVNAKDYNKARTIALNWLKQNDKTTQHIHDAD